MSGFCVEKIAADRRLRADDGILRTEALTVTGDAHLLAKHIVQEAKDEAESILSQAREQARQLEQEAEADVIKRAAGLLAALEQANATVASRVQQTVIDLALNLFDRLVMQATPRKRIEASLMRISREAPTRLVDPVLRVHPEDLELLPEVEWELKRDASMARGACRLEASNGEWQADFSAGVEALRMAFSEAAGQSAVRATEV